MLREDHKPVKYEENVKETHKTGACYNPQHDIESCNKTFRTNVDNALSNINLYWLCLSFIGSKLVCH